MCKHLCFGNTHTHTHTHTVGGSSAVPLSQTGGELINSNLFFLKYQIEPQVFSWTALLLLSLSQWKAGTMPRVYRTRRMNMHEILWASYWPALIIKKTKGHWSRSLFLLRPHLHAHMSWSYKHYYTYYQSVEMAFGSRPTRQEHCKKTYLRWNGTQLQTDYWIETVQPCTNYNTR